MSGHTRDGFHAVRLDNYRPHFYCTAPEGSPCRSGCDINCPAWTDGDGCDHPKTRDLGYCNVTTWLEEMDDTYDDESPAISLPIEYRWNGDNYVWRVAT